MPKHEALTPKAIANRIKAKGLQKLRWYCQMCQKQCRDENGYKCHCASEAHIRQMGVFSENPENFMNDFSTDFEKGFLTILKRKGGRVHSNVVYQEYIADRNHIHMNATIFDSLSNFVQYLGRTGKAVVDQTPKGWFCAYINRDPDAVAKQEALQAKEHSQLTDEELAERIIQQQMAMARQTAVPESKQEFQEFIREDPDQKLSFSMKQSAKLSGSGLAVVAPIIQTSLLVPNDVTESVVVASKRKRSALEELMEEEEAKKRFASASEVKGKPHVSATSDHLDNWICKGIVVKIMNKSLAHGEFYKAKAEIIAVHNDYIAELKVSDTGDILKIDQSELETVLPALDRPVKVVNGSYRGQEAQLIELVTQDFCATIKLLTGPRRGTTVSRVPYEDICKLA